MSKVALVTGGAGFIGSHMVDILAGRDYEIRIIDNLIGGREQNLLHHSKNKKVKFEKKSILDINANDSFIKDLDYVFHFAGIGDIVPSIENPLEYLKVNSLGTANILDILRSCSSLKKFVYAASSSCYGNAKVPTNENNPISLLHPYAASKYYGEQICLHWNNVYKMPINSIRIFNAYGTRVSFNQGYGAAFSIFLKQKLEKKPLTIVGNGKQKRDFIFATDLAKAFYLSAKSKYSGEIYNLGTGKPTSVNKIATLIGGKKINIPRRPGEPNITQANINKIKKHLKWKPKVSISKGTASMIKNINFWKKGKLWTKTTIMKETKEWFKILS